MACDSLYCAWLKVHYPYELYVTMLKLYDEKKNTDKISSIIAEMKRYKNISLIAGQFGQDNRDWMVDKEKGTISQSLSAIKHISKQAARDLYKLGQQKEGFMGTEIVLPKLNKEGRAKKKQLTTRLAKADPAEAERINAELADLVTKPEYLEVEARQTQVYAPMDSFVKVLRAIQMSTCVDTQQIEILIELNYFSQFGESGTLMRIYEEFFNGENKLTKTIRSFSARLKACEAFAASLPPSRLPLPRRLQAELSNIGLCLSPEPDAPKNLYFVKDIDDKYGVKATLYSACRGTSGIVRFKKDDVAKRPFEKGDCVELVEFNKSPRFTYRDGQRTVIPGEKDIWAKKYNVLKAPNSN